MGEGVGEWVDGWEKGYAKLPHTQIDWASMQNLPIPATQQSQIKAKPVAEEANVESVEEPDEVRPLPSWQLPSHWLF